MLVVNTIECQEKGAKATISVFQLLLSSGRWVGIQKPRLFLPELSLCRRPLDRSRHLHNRQMPTRCSATTRPSIRRRSVSIFVQQPFVQVMTWFCLFGDIICLFVAPTRPQQVLAASAGVPLQAVIDQARAEAKSIAADSTEEPKK